MSDMPPPPPDDSEWSPEPPAPPQPHDAGATPAGFATLGTGQTLQLASAGRRLGARIIDGLILIVASIIVNLAIPIIGGIIVGAAYEIIFVTLKGQTPGKMATGIRIVRADSGAMPEWGVSTGRWAIPAVAYIVFIIPGLLVNASLLWDDRRQGWHDKAVKTFVVTA